MAEGVGFEPTDGLPHLLISRAMLKPQIIAVSLYFYKLVLFWCLYLRRFSTFSGTLLRIKGTPSAMWSAAVFGSRRMVCQSSPESSWRAVHCTSCGIRMLRALSPT